MKLNHRPRSEVKHAMSERPRITQPRPLNVRAVAAVGGWDVLGYRDRHFLVPAVSFEDGAQLLDHLMHIQQFNDLNHPTREQLLELRDVLRDAVALMGRSVRPLRWRARYVGPFVRLAWWLRLRRNPFRDATAAEVGALLGFFCTRQTMPRVRPAELKG